MSVEQRRDILRKLLLAVWSMATLVLLFCVVLLVREMIRTGRDPLAALRPEPRPQPGQPAPVGPLDTTPGTRDLTLYFANADAHGLAPETRSLEHGDSTVENCRGALKALIAGPKKPLTPILPANTQIRGLYLLEGGEMVVDFSRELISERGRFTSASTEALMVQGVVNTLTQEAVRGKAGPPVQRVRFLFEGSPPYETFPAHIDLSDPVAPDRDWIAAAASEAIHE